LFSLSKLDNFIDGLETVLIGGVRRVAGAFGVEGLLADLPFGALQEMLKILEVFQASPFWRAGMGAEVYVLYYKPLGGSVVICFLHQHFSDIIESVKLMGLI
jgi:hypothetical protein